MVKIATFQWKHKVAQLQVKVSVSYHLLRSKQNKLPDKVQQGQNILSAFHGLTSAF